MARMRANGLGPQGGVAAEWFWMPVPAGGLNDYITGHRMTVGMEYAYVTRTEAAGAQGNYTHAVATYEAGYTIRDNTIFAIALTPRWLEEHPEYRGFLRSPVDLTRSHEAARRERSSRSIATTHAMAAARDAQPYIHLDVFGRPVDVPNVPESEPMAIPSRRQRNQANAAWRSTALGLLPHDAPNGYGSPNGWRWWVTSGTVRPVGMPDNAVVAVITTSEAAIGGLYTHSTREADSWRFNRDIVAWAFDPRWLEANPQYDVMLIKADGEATQDIPECVTPEVAPTIEYGIFDHAPTWYGPAEGWHWIRVINGQRPIGIPDDADCAWLMSNEVGNTYSHQTQTADALTFNDGMVAIAIDPEWLRDNPDYTGPCSGRTTPVRVTDPVYEPLAAVPPSYGDRDGWHWIVTGNKRPEGIPDDARVAWMSSGESALSYSHALQCASTFDDSDWRSLSAMAIDPRWLEANPDYTGPCSGRRPAPGDRARAKAKRIAPGNKPVPEPPMPIKHPPVPLDLDPVGLEDANHEVKAALRKVTQILEEAGRHGAEKLGAKMGALQATYEQRHTDLETAFKNMREKLEAEYSRRSALLEADIEPRIAAEVERRVTEYKAQVTGRNVSAGKRKLEL